VPACSATLIALLWIAKALAFTFCLARFGWPEGKPGAVRKLPPRSPNDSANLRGQRALPIARPVEGARLSLVHGSDGVRRCWWRDVAERDFEAKFRSCTPRVFLRPVDLPTQRITARERYSTSAPQLTLRPCPRSADDQRAFLPLLNAQRLSNKGPTMVRRRL